jgi:hypothetical protein
MRFHTFEEFILEGNVPLSVNLKEYTVTDLGDGKFSVEIDGAEKQFSVLPIPEDIEQYEVAFFDLNNAMETESPSKLYDAIKKIESMNYDFGNVASVSLSLNNVEGLALELTDQQNELIKTSEVDFLKNNFSSLNKSLKNSIMQYLQETAQLYAIVLESLFYYTREGDITQFYEGMDFNAIVDEYQQAVDLCAEKHGIVYNGPYSDIKNKAGVESPVDYIYWVAEDKDTAKKWILRATTSPQSLNSEENIIGKKGLNFTFLDEKMKEISDDYTSFPYFDLEKKATSFISA